jgi:DNA-binding FadR family transcriptional regulator
MHKIKKQHIQIVDLIKKRDAEYSLRAMVNHLCFVLDCKE